MKETKTTIAFECNECGKREETVVNHKHRVLEDARKEFTMDVFKMGWTPDGNGGHLCPACNPDHKEG